MLRYRNGAGPDAFDGTDAEPFFAVLRAYRGVVATYDGYDEIRRRFEALRSTNASPQVRLAALRHLGRYAGTEQLGDVIDELDAVASLAGASVQVKLFAAELAQRRGDHADAASRFRAVIDAQDARSVYLDASRLRKAYASSERGLAQFRPWMLARRDRLVGVGTSAALVAAATMLDAWGTPDDLEVVIQAVRRHDIHDPQAAYRLGMVLNRRGFTADAERLVKSHTGSGRHAHAMLLLAAQIAENDNRHAEAASLVAEAMSRKESMPLAELRNLYARRFQLLLTHARSSSAPHIDEALAVASDWRREDPDNPQIDKLCFNALSARGDHVLAFRHLSSIIERHPAEGAAYADVAQALVAQGRHAEAEHILERAIEVEPTNPNWLLRQADVLTSLRRQADARAVLERVVEGTWQDRFSGEVAEAKQRLER